MWVGLLVVFLPLAGYYLTPYLLISRHVTLRPYVFAIVLFLYTIGNFFHYVSDAQKFFTLRERKGLIEDGLFTRTRNPNYLGEILIYLSYASMSIPVAHALKVAISSLMPAAMASSRVV